MNCQYYRELISARQDDELPSNEEGQLLEHLAHCESCRKYAREIKESSEIISSWPAENLPAAKEEVIIRMTRHRAGGKSAIQFLKGNYRIPRGIAWATMVLLVFLLIEYLGNLPNTGSETAPQQNTTATKGVTRKIVLTEHDIVSHFSIIERANN